MPTYSFKCPKCKHQWTSFMWMSEVENHCCPECGAKAERDYSNHDMHVHFQGKGFYAEGITSDEVKAKQCR